MNIPTILSDSDHPSHQLLQSNHHFDHLLQSHHRFNHLLQPQPHQHQSHQHQSLQYHQPQKLDLALSTNKIQLKIEQQLAKYETNGFQTIDGFQAILNSLHQTFTDPKYICLFKHLSNNKPFYQNMFIDFPQKTEKQQIVQQIQNKLTKQHQLVKDIMQIHQQNCFYVLESEDKFIDLKDIHKFIDYSQIQTEDCILAIKKIKLKQFDDQLDQVQQIKQKLQLDLKEYTEQFSNCRIDWNQKLDQQYDQLRQKISDILTMVENVGITEIQKLCQKANMVIFEVIGFQFNQEIFKQYETVCEQMNDKAVLADLYKQIIDEDCELLVTLWRQNSDCQMYELVKENQVIIDESKMMVDNDIEQTVFQQFKQNIQQVSLVLFEILGRIKHVEQRSFCEMMRDVKDQVLKLIKQKVKIVKEQFKQQQLFIKHLESESVNMQEEYQKQLIEFQSIIHQHSMLVSLKISQLRNKKILDILRRLNIQESQIKQYIQKGNKSVIRVAHKFIRFLEQIQELKKTVKEYIRNNQEKERDILQQQKQKDELSLILNDQKAIRDSIDQKQNQLYKQFQAFQQNLYANIHDQNFIETKQQFQVELHNIINNIEELYSQFAKSEQKQLEQLESFVKQYYVSIQILSFIVQNIQFLQQSVKMMSDFQSICKLKNLLENMNNQLNFYRIQAMEQNTRYEVELFDGFIQNVLTLLNPFFKAYSKQNIDFNTFNRLKDQFYQNQYYLKAQNESVYRLQFNLIYNQINILFQQNYKSNLPVIHQEQSMIYDEQD